MNFFVYIGRLVIAALLLLLLALAPAMAQTVVSVGETSSLAVDSVAGETYSWELYNVATVNFATKKGETVSASYAQFVGSNTKAKVNVLWKEANTYFFKVNAVDAAGCATNLKVGIITVQPADPSIPAAPTAFAIQPACLSLTGSVVLSGLPSNGSWTIIKNHGESFIGGSVTSDTIKGLSEGTYNFTVTNSRGKTSATSRDITIVNPPDPPIASVTIYPDNNGNYQNTLINFTAIPVNGGSAPIYHWKVNGIIVGTNSDTCSYRLVKGDKVSVEMISNDPCVRTKPVSVEYPEPDHGCELFIPNAFSPNPELKTENVHNTFKIYCFDNYPNAKMYIFDQLGNKIYEKAHYGNLTVWSNENAWWDGKPDRGPSNARDQRVAVGTYFYVLDLGNGQVMKGFVFVSY